MEKKYTPGPWRAQKQNIGCTHDIYDKDHIWIGSIHDSHTLSNRRPSSGFPSDEEGKANSFLIAAAPDLLAALERLHDWVQIMYAEEYHDDVFIAVEAALKKAVLP